MPEVLCGCKGCATARKPLQDSIDQMLEAQKEIRTIIADMKSNHDTHKNYIKRLEQALTISTANPNRITL